MENELTLKCHCCKADYINTDKFCSACGYPFQGTPEEQRQFSINFTLKSYDKDVVNDRIKEARVILYVIAAFTFLSAFILYAKVNDGILLTVNIILSATYFAMGFWARSKPFAAIFTGTLIYLSIIIFSAFIDPASLFSGIIFKVIFIAALIKASYGASKLK